MYTVCAWQYRDNDTRACTTSSRSNNNVDAVCNRGFHYRAWYFLGEKADGPGGQSRRRTIRYKNEDNGAECNVYYIINRAATAIII